MLRALAPCLLLLFALPGAPSGGLEVRAGAELHEEEFGSHAEKKTALRRRSEIRLHRAPTPTPGVTSAHPEPPPIVAARRLGPLVARRRVRPPPGA